MKMKIFKKINENKLMLIILIVGIMVRVIGIGLMPNALNCDEASAGYEAYSILNYGIDRNGNFLPVFLVAWGSGQNALLTYLIIPFIRVFGLSVLSVRLPMVIISSISLIVIYKLLNKIGNKKLAIIGLSLLVISPWHIMKSRWGLESNLFPDLILLFVYMLISGLESNNKLLYYSSFIIAGISAYAYGTSYYFLPVFIIPLLIMLIRKKHIKFSSGVISLGIVGVISLPIILYVLINTLGMNQINLPFMTIPVLDVNRYESITSIFSSSFVFESVKNILKCLSILVFQSDGLAWNNIFPYGIVYVSSIVFTFIGIIDSFKKNKIIELKYNYLFNIWFIVSIVLSLIVPPNINRLNIFMIPIIIYTIEGIYIVLELANNKKKVGLTFTLMYLVMFILFLTQYCNQDYNEFSTFEAGLDKPIKYVKDINKDIYITKSIKMPYIYTLFYTEYDTRDFVESVEYENEGAPFERVKSFGKYHFENIKKLKSNSVYIIEKEDKDKYNLDDHKITYFEKYIIIET